MDNNEPMIPIGHVDVDNPEEAIEKVQEIMDQLQSLDEEQTAALQALTKIPLEMYAGNPLFISPVMNMAVIAARHPETVALLGRLIEAVIPQALLENTDNMEVIFLETFELVQEFLSESDSN